MKQTEQPSPDKPKSMNAVNIENEHLKGLISAMGLRIKKTEDLEKELASMTQALEENEQARQDLRQMIEEQAETLEQHKNQS